ncbi:hypothetical protein EV643_1641 [Kribbella sp. VKM Ac-2527]|uniref:Uncharacterized protein n=1 Tax=Kribbella caucasensis TaxID=2512215 RepID=A0A4R6IXV0_9ACTN|nr:hypothetical protein [Kribbella sp. VKM Ac-2527]TDO27241.1 hypothetical protein EV643_1641 [Kribbella sp. VKM Ac-2527]
MEETEVNRHELPDHLTGGHAQHIEAALEVLGETLDRLNMCLGLLTWGLDAGSNSNRQAPFANDLGALACFTRAYRGLRACISLCVHGYYVDVEANIRTVYEAAGLGRMLAKSPELAEKWLHKGTWVPDKDVRTFIEAQVLLENQESPYQKYYKLASAAAHPSASSTVPLVFDEAGEIGAQLEPRFDESRCLSAGREIMVGAVFTLFAMQRASADVSEFPTWWRQALRFSHRALVDCAALLPGATLW